MGNTRLSQRLSQQIGAAAGWRVSVAAPPPQRCVVVGAYHTSAWDLAATLLLTFGADLRLRWVAEAAFFRGPGGPVLRALGGMPVRRDRSSNFVAQMVAAFADGAPLRLAILPEGTRKLAAAWKTGFYHIARGAGVPIVLGYADYRRKLVGLGPTLQPSGDIQADFAQIGAFYAGVTGKNPHWQGPVRIAPAE